MMIPSIIKQKMPVMILVSSFLVTGCQTAYYGTMEKFGVHKRDILAKRVVKARDSQEEAKQQFKSALHKFNSVLNNKETNLKAAYDQLNDELEISESKAKAVSSRIASVEDVSDDLFDEWKVEISQYSSSKLRRLSQRKYTKTRQQYKKLIAAMKRAESKIEPVLSTFRDQVLFLKHNLNAQAISSLQGELVSIESNVKSLIKEMEKSIKEADSFIDTMNQE
jgi:hypothetical protein